MGKEYIDKEKFKHLFKGELDYESPIKVIDDLKFSLEDKIEGDVYQAVLNLDIEIDKEELWKALKYDRGQYEKGFQDAMGFIEKSTIHCAECTYRHEGTKLCQHPKAYGWDAIETDDDAYCSYGKRRNENG